MAKSLKVAVVLVAAVFSLSLFNLPELGSGLGADRCRRQQLIGQRPQRSGHAANRKAALSPLFSCRFLMPAISPEPFNQAYFIDIKPPLIFPVYAVLIF